MDKITLIKALERIANCECRSDRRHRGMVGVEEMERVQRTARTALYKYNLQIIPMKGQKHATS